MMDTMSFETVTIPRVEICRVGTWNGATGEFEITTEHFADAVLAASDPEVQRAPMKWGHDSSLNAALGDGAPAYGWLENPTVSEDGKSLFADLAGIPAKLAGLIGRAYKQRSIEMRMGVKTPSGRTYKAALTGLALLGATPPAVKGMDDLAALYASESTDHSEDKGTVTITMSETPNHDPADSAYTDDVSDKTTPPADADKGASKTDERPVMATLTPEALKSLGLAEDASAEDVEAAITALAAKVENVPAEPQTAALSEEVKTELEGRVVALSAEVQTLRTAQRERDVTDLIDNAVRDGRFGPAKGEELVKKFGENFDVLREVVETAFAKGTINMSESGTTNAKNVEQSGPSDADIAAAYAAQHGIDL